MARFRRGSSRKSWKKRSPGKKGRRKPVKRAVISRGGYRL